MLIILPTTCYLMLLRRLLLIIVLIPIIPKYILGNNTDKITCNSKALNVSVFHNINCGNTVNNLDHELHYSKLINPI